MTDIRNTGEDLYTTTTLIRHFAKTKDFSNIWGMIQSTGHSFEWIIGVLGWHDKYWQESADCLPGVFFEAYSQGLFDYQNIQHIVEAIIFGDNAQIRLYKKRDQTKLALLYESMDDNKKLIQPDNGSWWSEPDKAIMQVKALNSIMIQDKAVFPYAEQRKSFGDTFKHFSQKGIKICQFIQNGSTVDWRICP